MRPTELQSAVSKLHEQGLRVNVEYKRRVARYDYHNVNGVIIPGYFTKQQVGAWGGHYKLDARGGEVRVSIWDGDTWITTGVASCSDKDNFNGKVGQAIALGRALKQMQGR